MLKLSSPPQPTLLGGGTAVRARWLLGQEPWWVQPMGAGLVLAVLGATSETQLQPWGEQETPGTAWTLLQLLCAVTASAGGRVQLTLGAGPASKCFTDETGTSSSGAG